MDVAWIYGGPLSRGSLSAAAQLSGQACVHRPTREDQIWLPHHNGGREEVTRVCTSLL